MLNDLKIKALYRQAQKGELKAGHKISDGGGLILLNGRYWRLCYRFGGKQKTMSLGPYPVVSLSEARKKRDEAKKLLVQDIDPMQAKKEAIVAQEKQAEQDARTFEVVAHEWYDKKTLRLADKTRRAKWQRIERHLLPYIGNIPIAEIEFHDLVKTMEHMHDTHEMAHRVAQIASKICRYAKLMRYIKYDVSQGLVEILPDRPQVKHRARLVSTKEIGLLLQAIDSYTGFTSTKYALKLMPHVFLRSKELRLAKWEDIDLEKGVWTVPASIMKMRREHIVPLSRQVKEMLCELHDWTGGGEYLFPSVHSRGSVITDVTLLNSLRRLGYTREEMSIHGFRGIASTLLNEMGFNSDLIESQLAHMDRDRTRAAYNQAQWLPQRKEMMQAWSDYLDKLKAGANNSNGVVH